MPFVTADQLVAHAIGDYVIQSDWMASEKTKRSLAAGVHALSYALPFVFLTTSPTALIVIVATHFAIDRWRLARYVCWAKNMLAPRIAWRTWLDCASTGSPPEKPPFIAVWLLIIVDNIMHVLINAAALRWIG
jgi:hypothetical protein